MLWYPVHLDKNDLQRQLYNVCISSYSVLWFPRQRVGWYWHRVCHRDARGYGDGLLQGDDHWGVHEDDSLVVQLPCHINGGIGQY